jgi:hypothetical protein
VKEYLTKIENNLHALDENSRAALAQVHSSFYINNSTNDFFIDIQMDLVG